MAWGRIAPALLILLLIILAHVPFGLFASAMVLAFRTAGPLPQAVVLVSSLLGGVYYPTAVIPGWIQRISGVLPLTYGLRPLRQVLLDGASFGRVLPDVLILGGSSVVLLAAGAFAFAAALRYARRTGTLSHY
jgi:ABC-2 type transport system permease protein